MPIWYTLGIPKVYQKYIFKVLVYLWYTMGLLLVYHMSTTLRTDLHIGIPFPYLITCGTEQVYLSSTNSEIGSILVYLLCTYWYKS